MLKYIKSELLVLVPLLIGVGQILKTKLKISSNLVPLWLCGISVVLASIYGLITSDYEGWRMFLDGIVYTGICHGLVAAFAAMGLYDTVTVKSTKSST